MTDPELIRRAEAAGIAHHYRDWRGEEVAVSEETLAAILVALDEAPDMPDPGGAGGASGPGGGVAQAGRVARAARAV